MDYIVTTDSLTKVYGAKKALDNVSFNVEEGEILGLVGKNGAGKTTLIRVLTDVARATSGTYTIFGETTPEGLCKARRQVAAMVERPAFFDYMNAFQNLYNRALLMHVEGNISKYCYDLLDFVGLSEVAHARKKVRDFSLGMKQRLGIAIALMGDPKLLILDEPTNGLDPEGIIQIRELLLRLNREKGITIIIASHILSELSKLATRYCFIKEGKVIRFLTERELEDQGKKMLHLEVDDGAKAKDLLQGMNCTVSMQGSELVVSDYHESADVLTALIQGGVRISKLREETANLEDFYLKLMEENA